MCKLGILYICTGKYDIFWEGFYKSCEKYFLPGCEKYYYVFTDAKEIYAEGENSRITKVYQENLGWPYNTLKRFSMFKSIEDKLVGYDYLFFMNANIQFIKEITEDFLPINENLLVVQHPAFYNKSADEYCYDRNEKGLAYIPFGQGKYYVQGALNGGKVNEFLKLITELDNNVEEDLKNDIIALWHDESHLNRYILNRNDIKVLGPEYVYPEDWDLPFEPVIITRDKKRFGGHNSLRDQKVKGESPIIKLKRFVKRIINI